MKWVYEDVKDMPIDDLLFIFVRIPATSSAVVALRKILCM